MGWVIITTVNMMIISIVITVSIISITIIIITNIFYKVHRMYCFKVCYECVYCINM